MAGGRPSQYNTAEELILAVENYFEWVKGESIEVLDEKSGQMFPQWVRHPEPITVTGLALYLGFESRQSIYDYGEKGEFSYVIKNARLRVENAYEKNLYSNSPTGSIFALKNMGWKDKHEQEISGPGGTPLVSAPIEVHIVSGTKSEGD